MPSPDIPALLAAVPESLWGVREHGAFPSEDHKEAVNVWLDWVEREFGSGFRFGNEVAEHTGMNRWQTRRRFANRRATGSPLVLEHTTAVSVAALRASEGLGPVWPAIPEGEGPRLERLRWTVLVALDNNSTEAAEVAGYNPAYVRKLNDRDQSPSPAFLAAFAPHTEEAGATFDWLMWGEGEGPPLEASSLGIQRRTKATPEASDIDEPDLPERREVKTYRVLRDTKLARQIKAERKYECELCGTSLRLANGKPYAEAHHVRPLGGGHKGKDVEGNILCVCPNCHVRLDYFAIKLEPDQGCFLSKEYRDYHNEMVEARAEK